jgi:hypothetical protein
MSKNYIPILDVASNTISDPHGEEARSAVSNHEASFSAFILRDAANAAPQDEGIERSKP